MSDEDVPDYLKERQKGGPIKLDDNFGHEDVVWQGENYDLDPDEVLEESGYDPGSILSKVISAIVSGYQPDLDRTEIKKLTRKIEDMILGVRSPGRREEDDYNALLEIADEYHKAWHEAHPDGRSEIQLRPIVRKVVDDKFSDLPEQRNIEKENYIRKLGDKFKKNKDFLLVRATFDSDFTRNSDYQAFKTALEKLGRLNLKSNFKHVRIKQLSGNNSKRNETPGN